MENDIDLIYKQVKAAIWRKHLFNLSDVSSLIFGDCKPHNFKGGCNDRKGTYHEVVFGLLYPWLKSQVSFGTGKGGYEKYGVKRYIADFYDEERKIIYEIDGKSHNTKIGILKDAIRNIFFRDELGIKTIRFTNEEVEQLLRDRLAELKKKGAFDNVS
ncbi:DUF559 domain-containing protein [Bacillus cereus group sp. BfR-BA-01358]|uniref:DUF559 domain-containing protein n=1 Tax=Bacillus cereus group sp. BfR-BA-01358 TaxID=2920320 RepID=UPI001F594F9B|nr:DUF559 domain-containing protein [Bacillus cereus group sp. BfR-BA-01358]